MLPADHDVKDMVVSGCRVRLAFFQTNGRWSVQGTVECGLGENRDVQMFETGACPTREDAEQEALGRALSSQRLSSRMPETRAKIRQMTVAWKRVAIVRAKPGRTWREP